MHIQNGILRAYIDNELSKEQYRTVAQHLEGCPACQNKLNVLLSEAGLVQTAFNRQPAERPAAHARKQPAYRQLGRRINEMEALPMWRKLTNSKYRPALVGLVTVMIFAVAFSFPQVRAVANSFLGLFRVQKVTLVQSAMTMNEVPDQMDEVFLMMEELMDEYVDYEIQGEMQVVETEAEAEALAGFDVRIPDTKLISRIEYQPQTVATMLVERDLWQALIAQLGYDLELPKNIDGAEVTVTIPGSVVVYVGDCDYQPEDELNGEIYEYNCSTFAQMPSPTVEAPEGLDLNQLGEIYLQIAGIAPEDAKKISQEIEWANTLVIPVPRDAEFEEIQVDGVSGYSFDDGYDGRYYSMLWLKDDIVYMLNGNVRSHQYNILTGLE